MWAPKAYNNELHIVPMIILITWSTSSCDNLDFSNIENLSIINLFLLFTYLSSSKSLQSRSLSSHSPPFWRWQIHTWCLWVFRNTPPRMHISPLIHDLYLFENSWCTWISRRQGKHTYIYTSFSPFWHYQKEGKDG